MRSPAFLPAIQQPRAPNLAGLRGALVLLALKIRFKVRLGDCLRLHVIVSALYVLSARRRSGLAAGLERCLQVSDGRVQVIQLPLDDVGAPVARGRRCLQVSDGRVQVIQLPLDDPGRGIVRALEYRRGSEGEDSSQHNDCYHEQ